MQIRTAIIERPDPALVDPSHGPDLIGPRENEVLVRITSCGVCESEPSCLHALQAHPGRGQPCHEGAGVVEAVGRSVTRVAPGDHVIVGFPYCGDCRYCRRGQMRYCEKLGALSHGACRTDGSRRPPCADAQSVASRFLQTPAWSAHATVLQQQLTRVPDHVDHDLMGPLGCSVTTGAGAVMNELRPQPGSSIVVFGCGAVGLSAVMAAQLSGASTIVVVDRWESRRALARELGATHALGAEAEAVAEIRDLTGGGADFVITCTNSASRVSEAMRALAKLGTCAVVGGATPVQATIAVDCLDMVLAGKRLMGIAGGSGQTPEFHHALMDLQVKGRFPLQKLVQHYDLADLDQAIEDVESGAVVKPIVRMH